MKALSFFFLLIASGIGFLQKKSELLKGPMDFEKVERHEELGAVDWHRSYDEAVAISRIEGKPVFILFQEVPGCATCRNYGNDVLSDPLLVEAIENSFVPLAIFNNKGGEDKMLLDRFKEPSWNNPVVRIVNSKGEDLIPRISGNYSGSGIAEGMQQALAKAEIECPEYLSLHGKYLSALMNFSMDTAYYEMYCFWSGEKHLGAVDGVLSTQSGFMKGKEVVVVAYDSIELSRDMLNEYASSASYSVIEENGSYRKSTKDLHYYLMNSDFKYIPLTELQQTKINALLGNGMSPNHLLSPKQLDWLREIRSGKKSRTLVPGINFREAWVR